MEVVTVNLSKDHGQFLGIGFKKLLKPPFCQVSKLVEHGIAAKSGSVHEGDLLLSVNGINVQHLTPDEVRGVLSRYSGDPNIVLELNRLKTTENSINGGDKEPVVNGYPVINIEDHHSTNNQVDGSSSSQKRQKWGNRRERRVNIMQPGNGSLLPDISEGVADKNSLNVIDISEVTERHSLTPEMSRKPLEEFNRASLRTSKSLDLANLPQWRANAAPSITLHNLLDSTEMTDRLHTKGMKEYKETGCQDRYCKGAFMQLKPKRPYATMRPKDDVYPLAEDFMKQYFESKKVALGNEYENKLAVRLWQIQQEIEEKGHYELTYEELVFGARTAWRNAPRCVNRIIWRQLEVLDCRHANTSKDMFEAIKHHIKFANNGGNLRSTITIFPQRTKSNADFRVWNSQLIGYAGYKNVDGTILGDPANVEFTEMCIEELGWTPPRTSFDVLPLVLQANGGDPESFEIPPELVLQCNIKHPEYDWFEELGLKWYALPAVSCLLLDCGGLEFPGVPFNGWYMGTEIARDLGDSNRYNSLKPIATKMGINTQTNKLWKDRAMVELNVAILHSFQSANFSIVDHHSTTESFMTHIKSETQTRGGCPADWVWIVPPISGSITPVFHQEMLLYHLSPSYEYQHNPWKYHNWSSQRGRSSSFSKGPNRFKKLATMVKIQTKMFRKVYQKRIKATILFATETGRARNYAHVVQDVFNRVFASKVCCMEDYDRTNLEHEQLLIIITSTFGSGDPPANGEVFGRYLLDMRSGTASPVPGSIPTPRSHRISIISAPNPALLNVGKKEMDKPLTQVKYAVFGLGSRAYPNFCTFAHTCDNLLKDLGAEMIYPCGEGDDLCGQEESFQAWLQQCYHRACEIYSIDPEKTESDLMGYKSGYTKEDFRIQPYNKSHEKMNICEGLKKVHVKDIQPFALTYRTKLQSSSSDRSTILVHLKGKGDVKYEPGDHIAIYPQNNAKLVNELIGCLNSPVDPDEPIYVESRRVSHTKEHWKEEKRMPVPVTIREAFTYYLDITNPPSPQFIKLLAKQATRASDQEELNELAKGGDKYEDWKYERFPNLIDVKSQFHSLKIDVTLLLQQLPLLQCRYYSISSSPRAHPGEVHATVAIVSFKKKNGLGVKHHGVCSTWLNRIELGSTVPCIIRQAHAFHMPEDPRTPIIMVGPGTGIAPYRSFWQERLFMKNESIKVHLSQPTPRAPPQNLKKLEGLGDRRRRKTQFEPPKLNLLQTPKSSLSLSTTPFSPTGVPMRRSLSDTEDDEEIKKILAAKQKSFGNMSLYFGCRRSDMDYIYKDELMRAKVSGALTELNVAFSRQPGTPKTYVQHLLKENADKIVRQLMEERGHFYVCGDISMAADVCRTLQSIFEENAAMSNEEARLLIDSLKDRGFYHEDIFGVTLKHEEVTTRVRTAAKKAWRIMVTTGDSSHPLKSPMTPMRLPSPNPGSRSFASLDIYDSSTLPSSSAQSFRQNKRPTVTVLLPPDTKPKTLERISKDVPGEATHGRPPRGKSSLQSGPSEKTNILNFDGGMKIITFEEPQKTILEPQKTILEPLDEVSESPLEVKSYSSPLTSNDYEPKEDKESLPEDNDALQQKPQSQEKAPQNSPPEKRESEGRRSSVKRIRTNSRVETVL